MVLFDGGSYDAGHTNPVASHWHVARRAFRVEYRHVHGFAVLGAELEDLANLDATGDRQRLPCRSGRSPSTALRKSADCPSGRSRSQLTPV